MWYKNISGRFFGLITNHVCDSRTDGQNYDSQDQASIATSRGKTGTNWYPVRAYGHHGPMAIALFKARRRP